MRLSGEYEYTCRTCGCRVRDIGWIDPRTIPSTVIRRDQCLVCEERERAAGSMKSGWYVSGPDGSPRRRLDSKAERHMAGLREMSARTGAEIERQIVEFMNDYHKERDMEDEREARAWLEREAQGEAPFHAARARRLLALLDRPVLSEDPPEAWIAALVDYFQTPGDTRAREAALEAYRTLYAAATRPKHKKVWVVWVMESGKETTWQWDSFDAALEQVRGEMLGGREVRITSKTVRT